MNIKPFVLFLLFFSLRLSNQWLSEARTNKARSGLARWMLSSNKGLVSHDHYSMPYYKIVVRIFNVKIMDGLVARIIIMRGHVNNTNNQSVWSIIGYEQREVLCDIVLCNADWECWHYVVSETIEEYMDGLHTIHVGACGFIFPLCNDN
jgi:lipid-A-disaccharide synthase-like uncharacterized protein